MSKRMFKSMTIEQDFPNGIDYPEDDFFSAPPFFGVIDGHSEPYWPGKPRKNFSQWPGQIVTGGQMTANMIKDAFSLNAKMELSLDSLARCANSNICIENRKIGLDTEDAGAVPGASFIIVKISLDGKIEIVQSGDCLAVWRFRNKNIGFTENPVYESEMERLATIDYFHRKHKGNQAKLWKEFGPLLVIRKQGAANIEYPVLNGTSMAPDTLIKYRLPELPETMIIFTDGCVDCKATNVMASVANDMLDTYLEEGLKAVFEAAKIKEQMDKPKHTVGGQAEKTAIVFEF